MFWGSASETDDSMVEGKDLNLHVSLKLISPTLYNTESLQYKKENEPKVLFHPDYR